MSTLMFLILALPLAHAQTLAWQPAVGAAVMIDILVILLLLAMVTILHLEQLKSLVYDEMGHLALTILMVALLVGAFSEFENVSRSMACGFGLHACNYAHIPDGLIDQLPFCSLLPNAQYGAMTCPAGASTRELANYVNARHMAILEEQMRQAVQFNARVGAVSSVSAFCNLLGTGLTVAGCSAYGVIRGPVGQLINALGVGIMELRAQQVLLDISGRYALSLLLPLGLLMRCLHFTRKAGGALIAIALSAYFVLPLATVLSQSMVDGFLISYAHLGQPSYPSMEFDYEGLVSGGSFEDNMECDPSDPDEGALVGKVHSLISPMDRDGNLIADTGLGDGSTLSERIIMLAIVRTLLMGALILTMTITSIRVLGKLLGTELEVWTIARLS